MSHLRIGTRGSQLALFQARAVATELQQRAGVACEIVEIRTSGDQLAEASLAEVGGKRLFVKEIEDALLAGDVDLAVHSSKDLPAELPAGLTLGAVLPREDPRDAIILPQRVTPASGTARSLEDVVRQLGAGAVLGTSSVRRSAQLSRLLAGAAFRPIRGNVGTRLRKLDAGEFDAIVLAAAGLRRLGHAHRISTAIPIAACVPAPGQGIIAVEIRAGDAAVRDLVGRIDDSEAAIALRAERTVVIRLGGGCQMPLGAYASVEGDVLSVTATVISMDGTQEARAEARGTAAAAEAAGAAAAEELLARGAGEILAAARRAEGPVEGHRP